MYTAKSKETNIKQRSVSMESPLEVIDNEVA